ncbi:DUF1259 domain-containing protein [Streptomyces roseolilacinus]|uniref:DUF1259 domain-containing protein n=1 Tax=Streptomyces roseolilacinus TaxID=66904 RepID=UPI00381DF386
MVHGSDNGMSRRRVFAAGGALASVLTGTGVSAAAGLPGGGPGADRGQGTGAGGGKPLAPVVTNTAAWRPVADVLGRPGALAGGRTVYRVTFPRSDLTVSSHGVTGLSQASYAAFARYPDGRTMVMGDLVATERELQRVTDALHAHGLHQTAVHKHLLAHRPPLWWSHFHGLSPDALALARAVRAGLDATATPGYAPAEDTAASTAPPLDLDTAAIDAALGAKGSAGSGAYRFAFARRETVTDHHRVVPPAMGVTTALTFHPVGRGRAAVTGDFVMIADEVQRVIAALRHGGISIVELHNHALRDEPRLFYLHFWAVDDAVRLARTLRTAKAATNVVPAT